LHLKNTTDKTVQAWTTISFPGGTYNFPLLSFQPYQTIVVDLQALKDSKKADARGIPFPTDATHGQIVWFPLTAETLVGRAEQTNISEGIAHSFSCSDICCSNYYGYVCATSDTAHGCSPNVPPGAVAGLTGALRGNGTVGAYTYGTDCNFNKFGPSPVTPNSWYTNPGNGVASVSGGSLATVSYTAAGTTNVGLNAYIPQYWFYAGCHCNSASTLTTSDSTEQAPVSVLKLANLSLIDVTPVPQGATGPSVVSGQSAQIKLIALDQNGATFSLYRGTVHFTSSDTLATLPSDYTFTSSDAGVHTFNVTLKTVSGTSSSRDVKVTDNASGINYTLTPFVWFQTLMDVEFWKNCGFNACTYSPTHNYCPNPIGSYYCTTSYLAYTPNQPSGYSSLTNFIALTNKDSTNLYNRAVTVAYNGFTSSTIVGDAGPTLNNPYWNTGSIPSMGGCLSDQLMTNLGISHGCNPGPYGQATIYWRFGN
jgi:hypothetical protein